MKQEMRRGKGGHREGEDRDGLMEREGFSPRRRVQWESEWATKG